MKNPLFLIFLLLLAVSANLSAQAVPASPPNTIRSLTLGVSAGYDFPLFDLPYAQLDYDGSRYLSAQLGYRFLPWLGVRGQYANLLTKPLSLIPDTVYAGTTPEETSTAGLNLQRHFLGLGPVFTTDPDAGRLALSLSPLVGRSWLSGGDVRVASLSGTQLVNTGYTDQNWAAKLDLEVSLRVTPGLSLFLCGYYLRHFGVHGHDQLDIGGSTTLPIVHGENVYDHTANPYTVLPNPPDVVIYDPNDPVCVDLSSVGINLGAKIHFGGATPVPPTACSDCCPDDGHNVIVTVTDEPTGQPISASDVVLRTMDGEVVATGTTNSFGSVSFPDVPHGEYLVEGKVFGVSTTSAGIAASEFGPAQVVRKELQYQDLRFILDGITRNKGTAQPEPGVVVRLTNEAGGNTVQDNSDARGGFRFRLDPASSYTLVGSKRNRLSDIERASTVGLTRSTTLFVTLELGVDDFDCGQGAVLDIKYPLDEATLDPAARFELDRLVNYLRDNPGDRVELGSHTDSRGSDAYNQSLSERRARSAVDYIVSRGIAPGRILARGYGESRLLNRCADGVDCSEAEHRTNRRTEASLVCR